MARRTTFYDPDVFPWVQALREGWRDVRSELNGVLCDSRNTHWNASYPGLIEARKPRVRDWLSYTFVYFTIHNDPLCHACPKTVKLLSSVPNLVSASFSSLGAGTHVMPHTGYTGAVLRCHLGLRVSEPDLCGLRVGSDVLRWREGEVLIFDDRHEHEVWNDGSEQRVVLLLDFVRPELPLSPFDLARICFRTTRDPVILEQATRAQWLDWVDGGHFPPDFELFENSSNVAMGAVSDAPSRRALDPQRGEERS